MHFYQARLWFVLSATLVFLQGCPDEEPAPVVPDNIFVDSFGDPFPFSDDDQLAAYARGQEVAERVFTKEEGLGPDFNLTSCAGCHESPVTGGGGPRYRNFLLVQSVLPDGSVVEIGKNGIQTQFDFDTTYSPSELAANRIATRNPIPFFGVGLLAEIPEKEILKRSDPDDEDGDGISGRPNYDRGFVGRFGRKAQTVSLEGFIRGPLFNHVGITSNPLSNEKKALLPVPSDADPELLAEKLSNVDDALRLAGLNQVIGAQAAAPDEPITDDDDVPDPELSEDDLFDLLTFVMLLAPPEPDPPTEASEAGRALFESTGCASCHTPALKSKRGLIPLYSDLLLHDMGDELADGLVMGVATGNEFRTQPLWGVSSSGPFLHDGRADTLDQAIRFHGGEGSAARDGYEALSEEERGQILTFLRSLGGDGQRSSGRLTPGAPIDPVNAYGGPYRALTEEEEVLYLAGRERFDRDIHLNSGLGPLFNGDSCRACHFAPTIGGAGPIGVNVMRQGMTDEFGNYMEVPSGSMAHRFTVEFDKRPSIDEEATFFEWRQPPPIYGIGLLGQIPDQTFFDLEDPDDEDGDGISGRAHILPDGRLGRYGWKADVPTVEEFMRDALSAENGQTLPDREGNTYGTLTDEDEFPDPEVSESDYDAMLFYMKHLGPPPPQSVDSELEAAGEVIFGDIGCASCHIAELATEDGTPVPLYSDLLLHQLYPEGTPGIAGGDARPLEFRTPPLWGIVDSGPYMHDGASITISDAIERHGEEGSASRDAFLALDEEEKAALIAFLKSI